MDKQNASMQDVASAAGVHRATVSRALRNDPRISEVTRKAVQEAAQRLGYQPHALVSLLMTHRRAVTEPNFHSVIAYITRYEKRGAWSKKSESFGRIYRSAEDTARRMGYMLEEFCINDPKLSSAAFSRVLRARGIHCMLIAPLPRPSSHMRLDWEHFCPVALGYSLTRPNVHRVATDHFGCLVLAMRQLRKLGHSRVGVLLSGWVNERTDRRWHAAHLVESEHTRRADRIPALITKTFDKDAFKAWFRKHRPTVVVGVHMYQVLAVLESMRVRVPEDVGVVSLELRDREAGMTGVQQNFERIGEAAVHMLVGMLSRGERGLPPVAQKVLIDGSWVEGQTVLRSR